MVVYIYPLDSWDNVVDVKHRVIVTQTFGDTSSTMPVCFLFGSFHFFFGICRCETDTSASLPHEKPAAAQNYLLYKKTFSDKSIHNKKQSFVAHMIK